MIFMEEKQKGSTRNVACRIRLNEDENNILDKICKKLILQNRM